jgi:phosphopantetheinyl transferase
MNPIFFSFKNVKIALLRVDEIKRGNPQKNEKLNLSYSRYIEKLGVKILKEIYLKDLTLLYTSNGKPFLKENAFISISHSKSLIGIAWSFTHNIALDIEEISPRIEKIESKFIDLEEMKNRVSLLDKTSIWSIKECIVKILDDKTLNFKSDIRAVKINEEIWRGVLIQTNSVYSFKLFCFENNLICFNIS